MPVKSHKLVPLYFNKNFIKSYYSFRGKACFPAKPGETFRVLKEKEVSLYGDASQSDDKAGVDRAWDKMNG
jgi:hypothetical protein